MNLPRVPGQVRGTAQTSCRICGDRVAVVGQVFGKYAQRMFTLARCDSCGYAFVTDPWTEYELIYDDAYYHGRGADPLTNYTTERAWAAEHEAVCQIVAGLAPDGRWLDYGAGLGGLVRHARGRGFDCYGYEPSPAAAALRNATDGFLDSLDGTFSVVTAIEVLEHIVDPLADLAQIRRLLKPGGVLFATTGNAEPYADRLTRWRYVVPEVHVSFFEPRTLAAAYRATGFEPEPLPHTPGFDLLLKTKVLKNLRLPRSALTDLIPSRPVAWLADRMTRLSEQPLGRAV